MSATLPAQPAAPARGVTVAELPGLLGETLGPSAPLEITQERIDRFADATDDHQWLHVDAERAAAGPFGATIAHGYLTLALGSGLLFGLLDVTDAERVVNYGLGKVRFPAPVPVGSQVALTATVDAVVEVAGGYQLTLAGSFQLVGGGKPVCVAEILFRYYGATA